MKEFLAKPGFMVSAGTVGADLSYLLAVIFTFLFLYAWRLAKQGKGTQHHKLIFVSMTSMVVYFCAYYYARQLGVLALEGKEGFGGSEEIYNGVFVPILTTHLILVTLGLILTFYMVSQGFRASQKLNGEYSLKDGDLRIGQGKFRRLMLIILGLWGVNQLILTFVRHSSWQASLAWALIFATIALVISIEKLFEKLLPDGAKRHRVLGRGTMVIYALILVTSTMTYLMLYVIYPAN
jgi:uncharacterized membrane protein YozB (DUF420 family)